MTELRLSIYLETTVPSYLTAWASRDSIVAGHEQLTRTWWASATLRYDLFVSQIVLGEATRGDAEAVRERLEVLRGITILPLSDNAVALANLLQLDEPETPETSS